MKKRLYIFFIPFCLLCMSFNYALADYDCYVNSNYKNQGVGSKEQPFNELLQATNADGCDNIFLYSGIYDEEGITVKDGMSLTGEDEDKTIITKDLKMEGESSLNNLSVITEKYSCRGDIYTIGVLVENNAKVSIINSIISNAREGIQIKEGGELFINDSKIIDNCKGFYVLSNSKISISNSEVINNWGEGIDIRGAVSGEIVGNKISGSGECNIELIIGNSDLKILNNSIINSKANGITVQFYDKGAGANARGNIEIKDNVILNNEEYGIGCKRPSGGNPGGSYWSETVKMKDNEIRENMDGIFSSSCKFSGKIKSEAIKVVNDEDKIQKEFYEFLDRDIDRQIAQTAIQNRSKVKTFFIGSDYDKLNELDDVIQSYEEYVRELDDLLENDLEYKKIIEKNKNDVVEVKEETKLFVEKERGKFSLLGWLFN